MEVVTAIILNWGLGWINCQHRKGTNIYNQTQLSKYSSFTNDHIKVAQALNHSPQNICIYSVCLQSTASFQLHGIRFRQNSF